MVHSQWLLPKLKKRWQNYLRQSNKLRSLVNKLKRKLRLPLSLFQEETRTLPRKKLRKNQLKHQLSHQQALLSHLHQPLREKPPQENQSHHQSQPQNQRKKSQRKMMKESQRRSQFQFQYHHQTQPRPLLVESLVKLLQVAKKMMVNHPLKIQLKYQEEKLKLPKKLLKTPSLLIMLELN